MFPSVSSLSRACAAGLLFFVAVVGLHAQPVDPLPSWSDGPTKARIVAFVQAVTQPGSKDYVAPADRIAVFSNGRHMKSAHAAIDSASMQKNADRTFTANSSSRQACGDVPNRLDATDGWTS